MPNVHTFPLLFSGLLYLFLSFTPPNLQASTPLHCDISIVGGGIAGLHTAYQLSKKPSELARHPRDICLFEKENRLGGRVYDVALDPTHPELVYGLGALRVMENQDRVLTLAQELNITLEKRPYADDLINSHGKFAFSGDEMRQLAYPGVSSQHSDNTGAGTENAFYAQLEQHRSLLPQFPLVRDFVKQVLGQENYEFFTDITRFRGEFQYAVSAQAYLDYMIADAQQCCTPSYPVGGMSQFALQMEKRVRAAGVRIFLQQPVQWMSADEEVNEADKEDKKDAGKKFKLLTPQFSITSRSLVVAANPEGVKHIKGPLANSLQQQPSFQSILGIKVVVINQQWPSSWWEHSGYEGKKVRRAWTTEHCLNFIEIPVNDYASSQRVTRSVYSDDVRCNQFWEQTLQKGGISAVEAEVMKGLQHLFPLANIPHPNKTVMHVWPAAWHWLRGDQGTPLNIQAVAQWAQHPLPGKSIAMAGEGYFISRSAWIDGAIASSWLALEALGYK